MQINDVLKKEIENINPDKEAMDKINKTSRDFCEQLKNKLKQNKIDAQVFVGGSLAKNTIVKKNKYDIDVFVRFNKKYKNKEISELLGKQIPNAKKVHGSRDYYQMVVNDILIEVIPVLEIKNPKQAKNVTDLSFFHVKYVVDKIKKNKKLANEIRLAKTFCFAQECYGAESYIHGFSGYVLELLILHYNSFVKFLKHMSNLDVTDKFIIDSERFYKSKQQVLIELNEAKLQSPIILIDPTFKERNAAASLNKQTLSKFQQSIQEFLKSPNLEFFIKKDIGKGMKKKYGGKLITIFVQTTKQAGDIAGTKSKKFFDFFIYKLKRDIQIKKSEFDYDEDKNLAYFYFVLDKKAEEIIKGPPITSIKNLTNFKKAHPNAFIKKGFAYAKLTHNLSFPEWFRNFVKKEEKIIKEMGIKKVWKE